MDKTRKNNSSFGYFLYFIYLYSVSEETWYFPYYGIQLGELKANVCWLCGGNSLWISYVSSKVSRAEAAKGEKRATLPQDSSLGGFPMWAVS